ncbi:hypothetical protein PPYR_14211 [Photinus pyralis]|uniref:Death domain-containing protein n=1 Tax=Photinus pyralis TaxID=7054 RepID=A0A5N4A4M0_PHOPY|nr:hypothetical protein PPYR_14211 [Photinus pyralis]
MPLCFRLPCMSDGNTSFLRAARAGHLDKVLEHLKQNIDINTSNANGLNALHLASKDGHVQVVEELLKRGAAVDSATKKGNTALHIASLAGQEDVVRLLVHHGASVNVQSQNGFTPLYMAAQENHDNVVKYLLANGANQSLATEDGFTPLAVAMQQGHDKVVTVLLENDTRGKVRLPALHIAAKKDDVKAAKLLLENEHNPDVTSKSGFTPLHIASHYGNESIANLLVQKGADVNYSAKHNISPLHVAAKWGKTNMVALLLDRGAYIESKTRDGLTPLHCAARSGHEKVVDMLLERSAPISSKTKNGLAPLHMAAQGDHVDAARILLYHRAPVDEVTVDYLTALHVAAHCGHARVAKLLLDRGADANARALNGFTPLHIACKKNRIKVVELLLKHGASIGATTESGLTPLHVASFMGCMNIVIYLLQHEANPDVPTVRGETPLHLAARANQTDIIRILLRNGANVDARAREQQTPLHIASRLGNVDIVMLLLQHGAKVDTTTKDMYTALHIAAKEGQDEVAAALLDNGASLNATTKKGFTPLHLAAKYGNIKVAKLLLQKEAPVDSQGKNGVTPLHVASHYDHQNVALLLLDKGASPHAIAKNGHTPLHIAARKNQMDIANTLLEYGAQPSAESKAGFTPLHLSAQEGHTDMTSLLLEHNADVNHQAKNGLTPLHLCAQEDRVPVAEILLKNGGEVDAQTKGGYTPLHVACHYGQSNMVKFLLGNGANVKSTTSIGYTPLHQAAQQGHTNIVNILLENSAQPNAVTTNGQTPLNIAQKQGYISVIDTLKVVTETPAGSPNVGEEKYRVVAPEAMQETFMSDSEEEGGEDTLLGDQTYRYLTADEMKSLGDDSLPIDVTKDERMDSNRMVASGDSNMLPPQAIEDTISPQHIQQNYIEYARKYAPDNVDVARHPINIGKLHWKNFLVSFLVDARGGAMRGCRHSGVRVIVPPRCAPSPTRITCRYVRPQRTPHPPPLMEGEALASRVLELGPVGVKFLGPAIIEVPHFAALRGKEREIVILRSDNGESWREHTVESAEEILNDVLHDSFEADDLSQMEDPASGRITRIVTNDFPQYFAVVSRVRQEVHAIGPEGGMVSSTVVPQVQAVFPQGALTKKIKVGLQAQPIDPELTAKLLGHGVAVSPVVTVEPRRRKFHKAITLSMPAPRAHSQGMINQYSGSAPTLRLLCSITGGTTRAQWEDVTGSTPLTFVNDCVSFTTTVSARFWLMDCRNIGDATKMATELYKEAIHVPFMAKFVVFAKRVDPLEARLRVFCMTDDKEDKTLEHQEHFTEVAKSRDVEVMEGKPQYIEFAGNLVPITKSGEQLQFAFRAFKENRLPFSVRVKDQHAEAVGRSLFMKEAKVPKGEPPQQPICILNIVLPDDIVSETISLTDSDSWKRSGFLKDTYEYYRPDPRLADMSNLLGEDWVPLANQLGLTVSEINVIKSEYPDSVAKQAQSMLRMWISQSGNRAQGNVLENALIRIGREDIIPQCLNVEPVEHISRKERKTYYDKERFIDADDHPPRESYEDKYSAEEKLIDETSDDDENFKKTVSERRNIIEKRLSAERAIPASSQRAEIVQEISTIKRQSMVEDKIAEVEEKHKPTRTTTTRTTPDGTVVTETVEQIVIGKPHDVQQLSSVTVTKRTTESITIPEVQPSADRRDSDLLEGVTQILETTKKTVPRMAAEDPNSPKLSKTPPPSPADFIVREQAATIQEWDATGKPSVGGPVFVKGKPAVDAERKDASLGLTQTTSAELTPTEIPKPKPRVVKPTDLDKVPSRESQKSPVRDDILDTDLTAEEETKSYIDKKKFWESIATEETPKVISKRMSLHDELVKERVPFTKRTSLHEDQLVRPVPKPRTIAQTSEVSVDSTSSELTETTNVSGSDTAPRIMSEYQSQFQDPLERKTKHRVEFRSEDSFESDKPIPSQEQGYISDSEDVEHYISDSEIEDRVPQIRSRQMSVFQPAAPMRKSIYERSLSLPTEDLYDISAAMLSRKQHFEELLRKEMVEEQFTTESEEDPSPEHKTLRDLQVAEDEPSGTRSVPESADSFHPSVKDLAKAFDAADTKVEPAEKQKLAEEYAELFMSQQREFERELEVDLQIKRSSTESEKSLSERSLENLQLTKDDSISRPGDSMEVHVDKSEVEDSEKITDNEQDATDIETKSLDSLNASEAPRLHATDDLIPEITVTLSGKQRRISEDSDESFDAPQPEAPIVSPIAEKSEASSPVHHPEQHVESTVWEASVESQPGFEKAADLPTLDRTRSGSHSEIEQIILESLHHQNILPDDARKIAAELLEDIESEIQKRHQLGTSAEAEPPTPETAKTQVSDYLRQLAETKGLDSREIQLVESVLACKQRQFSQLKRDDTQASSMEITDEDLKFSGTDIDYSPSASQALILQQLEAEKNIEDVFSSMKKDFEEQSTDESFVSKSTSSFEDGRQTVTKLTERLKSAQSVKGAPDFSTTKDHVSRDLTETVTVDELEVTEDGLVRKAAAASTQQRILHSADSQRDTRTITTDSLSLEKAQGESKSEDLTELRGAYETETKTQTLTDDKLIDRLETSKRLAEAFHRKEIESTTDDSKETITAEDGSQIEYQEVKETTRVKVSTGTVCEDATKTVVTVHDEVERTLSDESKSSLDESIKSPEELFSTCSSGRRGDSDTVSKTTDRPNVILRKTKLAKDPDTSSSSGNLKPDRRSGVDFEAYSSSGESHYHSFDLDSGKSRPCSSDVEGLFAAGSSEYESALTSQDISGRSHISEYHTAVSSLSSKESMKSLDSESSGNLASVEVSEISETLIASELEYQGDEEDEREKPGDFPDGSMDVSEDEFSNEPKLIEDVPSRMKRSHEMTFQPEPKVLVAESPQSEMGQEGEEKFGTSLDDGSVLSMSLSSTSSVAALRTVIELSRADEGSMNVSATSEQLSLDDLENLPRGSRESLVTVDTSTSTHPQFLDLTGGSVTISSAVVAENGVQNVSTQVTSRPHTPTTQDDVDITQAFAETDVPKKRGHRRNESTTFVSPIIPKVEPHVLAELSETDALSVKEVRSDEKKDVDECERADGTPEAQAGVDELEQAVSRTSESKRIPPKDILEKRDVKTSASSSEKSSFEEAEAEAAFSMVAHISPAHKVKQICPILEDEDAEKHELETRERAQKELEERRAQIRDHSPGSIPDIKVTQHMAPLIDTGFHYPDLELEEQETETQESTPETPASHSSKTSEETDQGKEYALDDGGVTVGTESRSEIGSVVERTIQETESQTGSPNSDSFEMVEKPDLMDDFVIIEEVGKEAFEHDTEGKSVRIAMGKQSKKHDEEVENYLIKSASAPASTDYEPASGDVLGFEFEDSPPQVKQKDGGGSRDFGFEYDRELEANKKWIEQQFQGDQAMMMAVGYGYEMDFERAPLEDIKEEEVTDFDPSSSRIGSVGSQKGSGGSKDSFSSTPDYDVLAGRKYFTRSGENDDVSMSSLQEFENLERAMSLENKRYYQGSQDSSSNGSFGKRYHASRNAQGDDVSVSSLKEFEGLEKACIAVHKIEQKVKEEEAMLAQIDEGQESIASETESCETMSGTDKKLIPDSDEEDYEKRMFEIDEIIRQAQSNVEKFIDMKDDEKPESIGRGDSLEEVSKVPDLDLDMPVQWGYADDLMATSTDSLDVKVEKRNDSADSLDLKTAADLMTVSTDSIEVQTRQKPGREVIASDSIEFKDIPDYSFMMTSSDSLELETGTGGQVAALLSDSIDEDGSRICVYDQSSSSTGKDFSSSVREEPEAHDPLDISSSTATHATCHYETDSVFSGSFTSGGSNTMVSSTDTIDPNGAHVVDLAAAVRKVWFDDDAESGGKRLTTEYVDECSRPYVTELIEPCEGDDYYSHTIHRRVELPPEVRKVTFKGPDANEQMRQYLQGFGEGEDVQEFEEVDADGNVHVKRIVQKRYVVKSDDDSDQKPIDWSGQGVVKRTYTDGQGTKTIYTQKFGLKHAEEQEPTSAVHGLLSSIASDTTGEVATGLPEPTPPRQQVPFRDVGEEGDSDVPTQGPSSHSSQRYVSDQHHLSEEMKQLLRDMEEESKK